MPLDSTPTAKTGADVFHDWLEMQKAVKADADAAVWEAMTVLSKLKYSESEMLRTGMSSGLAISGAVGDFKDGGSDTSVGDVVKEGLTEAAKKTKILKLLKKCWERVKRKLAKAEFMKKACVMLEVGFEVLLEKAWKAISGEGVLKLLVPFYGNVRSVIDGAIGHVDDANKLTGIDEMQKVAPKIAEGIPSVSIKAFINYAKADLVLSTGKHAYKILKGFGGVLAEIFTFGAWKAVELAAAVFEAVSSFVNAMIQGTLFNAATARMKDEAIRREVTAEKFRTMIAGCPMLGAVFFALPEQYNCRYGLISVLTNADTNLQPSVVKAAEHQVDKLHKMACEYVKNAPFTLDFRSSASAEEYGHIMNRIRSPESAVALPNYAPTKSKRKGLLRRFFGK